MRRNSSHYAARAFTLVEVLIAVSVAALAASGAFLGYQGAVDNVKINKMIREIQIMQAERLQVVPPSSTQSSEKAVASWATGIQDAGVDCGQIATKNSCKTPFGSTYELNIITSSDAPAEFTITIPPLRGSVVGAIMSLTHGLRGLNAEITSMGAVKITIAPPSSAPPSSSGGGQLNVNDQMVGIAG